MQQDEVWFSTDIPVDLPTHDRIVIACFEAKRGANGVCVKVASKQFWVKCSYGSIIRDQARTQAHVAEIVNTDPTSAVHVPNVYLGFSHEMCGYLVMDFIRGVSFAERKIPNGSYDVEDIKAVAAAFQQLINIKAPAGTAPGPIGGGYIALDLFVECLSELKYPSIKHLEAHVNEVIRFRGIPNVRAVDFQSETTDGLVLCPSYPIETKFMIDNEGKIWAIDFSSTCFPPPSFVSYSLTMSTKHFVRRIASFIDYENMGNFRSNVRGMSIAAGSFTICGDNKLASKRILPSSIKPSHRQRLLR